MLTARTVLLLAGLLTLSPCSHAAPYTPAECCFDYVKGVLRLEILLDFNSTTRECYFPAIVIVAANGDQICADPKKDWVKKIIKRLQNKTSDPSTI